MPFEAVQVAAPPSAAGHALPHAPQFSVSFVRQPASHARSGATHAAGPAASGVLDASGCSTGRMTGVDAASAPPPLSEGEPLPTMLLEAWLLPLHATAGASNAPRTKLDRRGPRKTR